MRRTLILLGLTLVAAGLLWPLYRRLPLGRLPGDWSYVRHGVRIYIPLGSALLVSLVLSLLIWLFRR